MSKPSVEQIKAWLRSLPGSMSAWSKRDETMREAIRCLIENVLEWQERAIYVLANIALGDEPDDERIYKALKLLEEIRDFGKENSGDQNETYRDEGPDLQDEGDK